jgi:hypothetical protein
MGVPQPLKPLSLKGGDGALLEDHIQALVHACPSLLPIQEIDPIFVGAVPVCREMETPVGYIDNFLVTPSGLPVLVECKLWRNAEARREVVGQILDYAKELALFSASDIRREASKRAGGDPDALLKLVRAADPSVDEVAFEDALTANLRRGRFLLLIVGEGIHERVERIAEFLQTHAGLHFTFGLVELPFYEAPDGGRLVIPRVLAKTELITRTVVAVPDGHALEERTETGQAAELDPETVALGDNRQQFWREFLSGLRLDDPDQPVPRPPRQGYVTFTLPAPGGTSWLTVYRDMRNNEVGLFLSSHRNTPGERAMSAIADQWSEVGPQLGAGAKLETKDGRPRIVEARRGGSLEQPEEREAAFQWLRDRTNTFINVLRPRVRSAVAEEAGG